MIAMMIAMMTTMMLGHMPDRGLICGIVEESELEQLCFAVALVELCVSDAPQVLRVRTDAAMRKLRTDTHTQTPYTTTTQTRRIHTQTAATSLAALGNLSAPRSPLQYISITRNV